MRPRWMVTACFASTAMADPRPPPPPPPPPPAPTIPKGGVTISAKVLESLRMSGSADIEPQPRTREAMVTDGVKTVSGQVELCLSTAGGVVYAEMTKSTGYGSYDDWIKGAVVDWTFHPYQENKKAVLACSTVTITYSLKTTGAPATNAACRIGAATTTRLRDLRADVDMICGAAKITKGTDFMSVGPYIAEHMKTDLLAELLAKLRTTTTLDMIVGCVRTAMAKTAVTKCATIDVLLEQRPR